tara:strand:+ start:67 stop:1002 length:936 start_codon:yes stop_codon:yes gene_type:complete
MTIDRNIDISTELVVADSHSISTLAPTAMEFEASLAEASAKARVMKQVISENNLAVKIGGGEHIKVEGWITLATAYGCTAQIVWSRKIEGYIQAYEAKAEVLKQTPNGVVVIGSAEAECGTRGDGQWENDSPEYAVRSMAQTRAISKAIAGVLRWVVVLAGYSGTPYDEMSGVKKTGPDTFTASSRGGGGSIKADPDSKYYCKEHDMEWFKTVNMTRYGHRIGKTKDWCDMPEEPEVIEQVPDDEMDDDDNFITGENMSQTDLEKACKSQGWGNRDLNAALGKNYQDYLQDNTPYMAWFKICSVKKRGDLV